MAFGRPKIDRSRMTTPLSSTAENTNTRQIVGIGLASRIVVDTCIQMFYAFLPIIAAGIGVTPVVMGRLISLRSLAGLSAPLAGGLTGTWSSTGR